MGTGRTKRLDEEVDRDVPDVAVSQHNLGVSKWSTSILTKAF
jgi:hypothetical protein